MNELQLVGYTADYGFIVFSDPDDASIRYSAPVDADLVDTLREIIELGESYHGLLWPVSIPVINGSGPEHDEAAALPDDGQDEAVLESMDVLTDEPEPELDPALDAVDAEPAFEVRQMYDDEPLLTELLPAPTPRPLREPAPAPAPPPPVAPVFQLPVPAPAEPQLPPHHAAARQTEALRNGHTTSLLSPREIQALLRAGKSPAVVARQAGVDEDRVRRWLPPIEAERTQVIEAVQRSRLSKARLGPSAHAIGDAVRRNLAAKGVDNDDLHWNATRRSGRDAWTVDLRYRSRGRPQRAVWRFDPDEQQVTPRNDLAAQISWSRGREVAAAPAPKSQSKKTSAAARTAKKPTSSKSGTAVKPAAPAKGAAKKTAKSSAKSQPARRR